MAMTFDTLGFSRHLRKAGVPQDQADAHAEAARDFIMTELVTKADLLAETRPLKSDIEAMGLKLTIRLGGIVAAGFAGLAALIKLHG